MNYSCFANVPYFLGYDSMGIATKYNLGYYYSNDYISCYSLNFLNQNFSKVMFNYENNFSES